MKTFLAGALTALLCHPAQAQFSVAATPTTSIQGLACLGSIQAPQSMATADPTDYVSFNAPLGVGCTYSMQVPLTATVPAGRTVGFRVASSNLTTVLNNLNLKTFESGTWQETAPAGSLLTAFDGGFVSLFFTTQKPFNSISFELKSTASVLQQVRVYNFTVQDPWVLPLYFHDLQVSTSGTARTLTWSQAADEAIAAIVVEKSTDGMRFTSFLEPGPFTVGRQTVADASGTPKAWYRLKGKTVGGKTYYSAIVSSQLAATPYTITSPSRGRIRINAGAAQPKRAMVSVHSLDGRLLWRAEKTLQEITELPVPCGAAGLYRVAIQADGGTWSQLLRL